VSATPAEAERLVLPEAELDWWPEFLALSERAALIDALREEIPWEQHYVRLFGRKRASPRLSCWIGDPDAVYTYSRVRFEPRPWTPTLLELRTRVERACEAHFNSVLANRYRSGADSMGFHSDDEPELGPEPVIASLSLGATRRFVLKHRTRALRRELPLGDGSLLVMRGSTQRCWQHAVPREVRVGGERINLTFRWIRRASAR
jgi:alkylated DNA repair dioxygenase AlkB